MHMHHQRMQRPSRTACNPIYEGRRLQNQRVRNHLPSRLPRRPPKFHKTQNSNLWNNGCHRKWAAMDYLIKALIRLGILKDDVDYHLLRASMVIVYFFFGYQKWFEYEAQALIPYISNGPLIFWMYPVFGVRGATYFLGVSEWLIGSLLLLGFWNKRSGILGALGSCFSGS